MRTEWTRWLSWHAATLLAVLMAATAHAGLVHRYTFNGNVCDSVGNAHGKLVDGGAPSAFFTAAGQLDLSANVGQVSNAANLTDAYVDLPNHIIQNAARSGQSGALSLEWWFTISEVRPWQRLGDFAGPLPAGGSEGVTNGRDVDHLTITPNSGRQSNGVEMTSYVANIFDDKLLGLNQATPAGVQHHLVAIYDKNNTLGGMNPGGTMSLYFNGVQIAPGGPNVNGSGAISEAFDLNNLGDEDNWLGRSQWPDPMFDGTFNEFSIYDHALSHTEVLESFLGRLDPVPLPTLIVNTVTGAAAIKNLHPNPLTLDRYEIASAGGSLNPADGAWNSLGDQEIDVGLAADFDGNGDVDGATSPIGARRSARPAAAIVRP